MLKIDDEVKNMCTLEKYKIIEIKDISKKDVGDKEFIDKMEVFLKDFINTLDPAKIDWDGETVSERKIARHYIKNFMDWVEKRDVKLNLIVTLTA